MTKALRTCMPSWRARWLRIASHGGIAAHQRGAARARKHRRAEAVCWSFNRHGMYLINATMAWLAAESVSLACRWRLKCNQYFVAAMCAVISASIRRKLWRRVEILAVQSRRRSLRKIHHAKRRNCISGEKREISQCWLVAYGGEASSST